jgi:outer membrane lipoprotein LolB
VTPLRRALLAAIPGLLLGCAVQPRGSVAQPGAWSGRLSLDVADRPSQSFAALFDLQGTAAAGELMLTTPIGSTIAQLQWSPAGAVLRQGGSERRFASIDAMVLEATGTALPVAALFDWLAGQPTEVPGWRPDLSQLPQGRLRAQRHTPDPQADLRVVIDR